ncbi:MAG: sulfotransferase [Actinomycetota bacterium]|nr:sulfotransferase [Actinomycetota bacterium]
MSARQAEPEGPSVGAADAAAAFIACTARSGSTLLRLLLDAHPELSCPSETDIAVLAASYVRIAEGLGLDPPEGRAGARRAVGELMGRYVARRSTARWCDKSLSNVFHLPLLAELFPRATIICLYRHGMDTIASGLQSSPWGLADYGFAQVAAMFPTNSVAALAAYWVDRTARMVDFADRHPDRCLQIRYEDLVADPAGVLGGCFERLGVAPMAPTTTFSSATGGTGPGDYRIWYTDEVRSDAVGTGALLPVDQIGEPLRAQMNALLARLSYAVVDDWWGSGGGPSTRREAIALRITERNVLLSEVDLGPDAPAAPPGAVVALERDALVGLREGTENPGSALRRRAVRLYGFGELDFSTERALLAAVRRRLARLDPPD